MEFYLAIFNSVLLLSAGMASFWDHDLSSGLFGLLGAFGWAMLAMFIKVNIIKED